MNKYTAMTKSYILDKCMHVVLVTAASCAIISVFLILLFIFKEALPIITEIDIRQEAGLDKLILPQPGYSDTTLKEFTWEPISEKPRYSILPLFVGTLKATIVALVISIPLAIFSALFVVEYSPSWLREIIKPCIELLATIPSVIIGLLGLMVISTIIQNIFGNDFRLNAVVAGVCLSFATIPIIFTLTEDALTAVPFSYREASLALGANKTQTILKIVLPVAMPGIFAAIILGFGRALGETMIVLMCSGNTPMISWNIWQPIRTISATIASEIPEVQVGSPHYHVLFFIGGLLVIFSFIVNLIGSFLVGRMKKRLEG